MVVFITRTSRILFPEVSMMRNRRTLFLDRRFHSEEQEGSVHGGVHDEEQEIAVPGGYIKMFVRFKIIRLKEVFTTRLSRLYGNPI